MFPLAYCQKSFQLNGRVGKLTDLGNRIYFLAICTARDYTMLYKLELPSFDLQVVSMEDLLCLVLTCSHFWGRF